MAKAYICPHCNAKNRFRPADSTNGVVRCGACEGAFVLPDFDPHIHGDPQRVPTAIIHAHDAAPGAYHRRSSDDPTRERRNEQVAASRAPTELLDDAAAEAIRLVQEAQASSRKARASAKTLPLSDRPLLDELNPSSPPTRPLSEGGSSSGNESKASIGAPSASSPTAITQPTDPPPEYVTLQKSEPSKDHAADHMASTQPTHDTRATPANQPIGPALISAAVTIAGGSLAGAVARAGYGWLGILGVSAVVAVAVGALVLHWTRKRGPET